MNHPGYGVPEREHSRGSPQGSSLIQKIDPLLGDRKEDTGLTTWGHRRTVLATVFVPERHAFAVDSRFVLEGPLQDEDLFEAPMPMSGV